MLTQELAKAAASPDATYVTPSDLKPTLTRKEPSFSSIYGHPVTNQLQAVVQNQQTLLV